MSTITKLPKTREGREKGLEAAMKSGARTLAGGLNLPIGTHSFVVADKDCFAILNVESKTSGKWALPIVAGTVTTADGEKIAFVLSEKPGAKTLVIPDNFFINMQPNTEYAITVDNRNGRKVVTNVSDDVAAIGAPAKETEKVEEEY